MSAGGARITPAEWRWLLAASLLLMLLSSAPYAAGYLAQTPDQVFGGAVFDRMDYDVRLAGIQTGLRGVWQTPLLHTSEHARPSYVIIFYILIGQLGRRLPLLPPALYEGARWLCGLWALFTMYRFAARFLSAVVLRRAAFLLFGLGSGVGWLMFLFRWQPAAGISPVDFWLIDLYGFFSLLVFPHFSAVFALLWSAALAWLDYQQAGRARWLAVAVVTSALAQAIQPFAPLIVDAALAGYALWGWLARRRVARRELAGLAALAVGQLPLLAYAASVFWGDPVWRSFSRQNLTLSPPPVYYLLGLGLPGALALWGGWRVARRGFGPGGLLVSWVLAVAILAYLPTQFQRRFTEGVMGPLAALAAIGLGNGLLPALGRWRAGRRLLAGLRYPYRRARGLVLLLALAAAAPSSLYLAFGGALLASTRPANLFEPAAVVRAIDWLGANSGWQDTVFGAEATGSYIPARIGHRVFLGHPIETANYAEKQRLVAAFFGDGMDDGARRALLAGCGCRYVFYGPAERAPGSFCPDRASFLRLRYAQGGVEVYEVLDVRSAQAFAR